MRAVGLVVVLALVSALVGCDNDEPGPPQEPVITLAKADGWRNALFDEHQPFALVEIAFDEATAEEAWSDNIPEELPAREGRPIEAGIYGDLDEVDFGTHAVVVWSSGQSGSCPSWLADIGITPDGELQARTEEHVPGDVCTQDYNPYRMVLAVARDRLPESDDLPARVDLEGTATGQATAYPFGGETP